MMDPDAILSPEVLQILGRVHLSAWEVHKGRPGGPHPSSSLGLGTRFEDFRRYTPGDDLRYLDWNALGRLGEPFIKQFAREEAGRLTLVLDRTASMESSPGVVRTARGAAAILAYLGLRSGYHVEVFPAPALDEGEVIAPAVFRGGSMAGEVFEWINRLSFGKPGALFEAVKDTVGSGELGTTTFLVTDMADPEAGDRILRFLRARRCRPALIQVISRGEQDHFKTGHREVVDPETGRTLRLRITPGLRKKYLKRLERFHEQVRLRCRSLGVRHARLIAGCGPDRGMIQRLREGGILQ